MFLDRYSKRGGYVKLQGGKAASCLRLRIYLYDCPLLVRSQVFINSSIRQFEGGFGFSLSALQIIVRELGRLGNQRSQNPEPDLHVRSVHEADF